jgi:hypothetical protein
VSARWHLGDIIDNQTSVIVDVFSNPAPVLAADQLP